MSHHEMLSEKYAKLYTSILPNASCGLLTCVKRHNSGHINIFIVATLTSCVMNLLLIMAVIARKNQLRQNAVYIYIASTLTGNCIYGLATFYRVIRVYVVSDDMANKQWFTFVQTFISVVFCVLCINMCFLVLVLRDHARFMARLSSPNFEPGIERRLHQLEPKYLRKKALARISVIWTVTIVYAVINALAWHCADVCMCKNNAQSYLFVYQREFTGFDSPKKSQLLSTCVETDIEYTHLNATSGIFADIGIREKSQAERSFQNGSCKNVSLLNETVISMKAFNCPKACGCSRYWEPMREASLIVIFVFWAIIALYLIGLMCRSYAVWPRKKLCKDQGVINENINTCPTVTGMSGAKLGDSSNKNNNAETNVDYSDLQNPQTERKETFLEKINFPTDRNYWYLVLLVAVLLLCTGPVMWLFFMDAVLPEGVIMPEAAVQIIFVLPVLYTIITPVVLLVHIPSLRSAATGFLTCRWALR